MKIAITVGEIDLTATLSDNETARAIYNALPFQLPYNTWGDEIYFSIPVEFEEEPVRDVLETGELAVWPPGNAFCIFYGRTPASTDDRPRAASNVIPFGKVDGDASVLKKAKAAKIRVQKVQE